MLTANLSLYILWDWQNESEDISLEYNSKWAHTHTKTVGDIQLGCKFVKAYLCVYTVTSVGA